MSDPTVGPAVPGVVEADVDGEACLHSPTSGEVLMLNQTASDVWFLCDGSLTLTQIVDRLAQAYDVAPEEIASDVAAIIDQFGDAGLLSAP